MQFEVNSKSMARPNSQPQAGSELQEVDYSARIVHFEGPPWTDPFVKLSEKILLHAFLDMVFKILHPHVSHVYRI